MIVAVCGGKGGVGKSTISWNMGREFGAVVVDADLATADLPRGRGPDLHDVLAGRASPMEAVEDVSGVRLLPSGRTLAGARAADLSELPDAVELLDRQFGGVLLDCPAGLARDVGIALDAADLALVVTTPKKPALLDAMKTRDLASEFGTPVGCVALNRTDPQKNYDGLAENVETEFSAPVTVVPEDEDLASAQAEWEPVRDATPEADALDGLESLAADLEACQLRAEDRADAT